MPEWDIKSDPRDHIRYHSAHLVMADGDHQDGLRLFFICIVVGQGNPIRGPE